VLTNVRVDTLLTVRQGDAAERTPPGATPPAPDRPFQPLDAASAIAYRHELPQPQDYSVQPLLPYMLSRQGPPLAVADVDGDGLDDVYVGGGPAGAGRLFLQQKDGRFVASARPQPWAADSAQQDWGALFFDANGDGRPDLYVASGGYQLPPSSSLLQDRLYVNQGGGRFVRDTAALPAMLGSKGVVRAADFDGDGHPDLFVGGRLTPRAYPEPARSWLLRNDGRGHFTDVTATVAPDLARPVGMITDAVWIDYDGDGRQDLVTAGEWMPVSFWHNDGGHLTNATAATHLPPMRGWWYSLAAGDFDGDGRPDLVAGNLGLNYTYRASQESRFGVYAADFTRNGTTDVVLTQTVGGTEYPVGGLASLGRAIYTLGVKFPTAGAFSKAPLAQLFGAEELRRALHYEADTFASVVLHNEGKGAFRATPLPGLAQIAPIRGSVVLDVDGDGRLDVVVAGNLYDAEPNTPRADAGNGLWLRGDGRGGFAAVPPARSGFLAPRDVAGLALLRTPNGGRTLLVANTADSLQAFAVGRWQHFAGGRR
jgi:hypothetical protein